MTVRGMYVAGWLILCETLYSLGCIISGSPVTIFSDNIHCKLAHLRGDDPEKAVVRAKRIDLRKLPTGRFLIYR